MLNNPAKDVNNLHNNDDVDSSKLAHHHTLGLGVNQAFPGVNGKSLETNDSLQDSRLDNLEVAVPFLDLGATANQNLANSTFVNITQFTTVDKTQGDISHSAGIVTVNEEGIYVINFGAHISSITSTTRVILRLIRNGGSQISRTGFQSPATAGLFNLSGLIYLNAADTVVSQVHQNSGGTAVFNSGTSSNFTVSRIK